MLFCSELTFDQLGVQVRYQLFPPSLKQVYTKDLERTHRHINAEFDHNVDHIFSRYACRNPPALFAPKCTATRSHYRCTFDYSPSTPSAHPASYFIPLIEMTALLYTLLIRYVLYRWIEGNYSPTSPLELQYGDGASSIYPDRPIRPLPKRRLRSRLSPGAVDSILNTQGSTSSVTFTQGTGKDGKVQSNGSGNGNSGQLLEHSSGQEKDSYQFRGSDVGQDAPTGLYQRTAPMGIPPGRNGYTINRHDDSRSYRQAHMPPPIPPSAASSGDSIDGYDSFENTNNKKKRKIPISGSLGNHHPSLSTDMAHMDISSTRDLDVSQIDPDVGVGQYYGSGSSAVATSSSHASGISGSGRGRFGRSGLRRHSGRSPLGVSFNGTNAMHTGRSLYNGKDGSIVGALGKPGNEYQTIGKAMSADR